MILAIVVLAMVHGLAQTRTPDVEGLALAIIEAAEQDAGFGASAPRPPIVSGPVLVDSTTLVTALEFDHDAETALGVMQFLAARGYSFGNYEALLRSAIGNHGITQYWLDGDPLLIVVHDLGASRQRASVLVSNYYNYRGQLCLRSFELDFEYVGAQWQLTDRKLVGQC